MSVGTAPHDLGWRRYVRLARRLIVVGLLAASPHAAASVYCEDVEGNYVVVGEARYFDDSTAYANSYWGGSGDELTLSGNIGGADNGATDIRFYMYGWGSEQDVNECDQATFTLDLVSGTAVSGGCPAGTLHAFSAQYQANSCGSTAYIWAGKGFGLSGLDYARHWKATVSVDSGADVGDAEDTDDGCFTLLDQSDCTPTDF